MQAPAGIPLQAAGNPPEGIEPILARVDELLWHFQHYSPIEELDGWLRRRIRMCYWKQWRRPRTRIANLLKLRTSKRHAILTGISRKGYWRLSKTLATQTGMTNEWLE